MFNKITQAFPIFFSYVSICSPHFSTFSHVFPHIFPIFYPTRPGARAAPAAGAHRVAASRRWSCRTRWSCGGTQREDGAAWFDGQWWDVNGATCSSLVKKLVNSEDFFWRTVNSVQDLAVKIGIFLGDFQTEWIVWVEQGVLYTGLFGCTVQKNTFLKKSMWMIQRGVYKWDYSMCLQDST